MTRVPLAPPPRLGPQEALQLKPHATLLAYLLVQLLLLGDPPLAARSLASPATLPCQCANEHTGLIGIFGIVPSWSCLHLT